MLFLFEKVHLVLIPKNMTYSKFLSNAKVRSNTYFARLLGNIYNFLTFSVSDLESEYSKYYSEYDSFQLFVYHKYPELEDDERKLIFEKLQTGCYRLYKGTKRDIIDYSLYNIFTIDTDAKFSEKIKMLLMAELYED